MGKSSLINALLNRKEVARISSTPGKTQTINYYLINDQWYIVDLPGYGYARISKVMRRKWKKMIDEFLLKRASLYSVFTLIDSRHSLQQLDLEFVNWLGTNRIPFVIAYTKIDKVNTTTSWMIIERVSCVNFHPFQRSLKGTKRNRTKLPVWYHVSVHSAAKAGVISPFKSND